MEELAVSAQLLAVSCKNNHNEAPAIRNHPSYIIHQPNTGMESDIKHQTSAIPYQPSSISLVECPRDAMQGWKHFIPTKQKITYIQSLLKVGFDTIDFGSFVSSKAIPQLTDTKEVLSSLELKDSTTKLLSIVANVRGAAEAVVYDEISYLGFPFSVSETFQQLNTNATIKQSLERVKQVQELCSKKNKQLVVYLSMGFGNPYGDAYSPEMVFEWAAKIASLDIKIISLADTVGIAAPEQVFSVTDYLVKQLPQSSVGVHLHAATINREAKLEAAVRAGCKRFDGALKGIGGCPMANNELVGNMDTELMVAWFENKGINCKLNMTALEESSRMATQVFV